MDSEPTLHSATSVSSAWHSGSTALRFGRGARSGASTLSLRRYTRASRDIAGVTTNSTTPWLITIRNFQGSCYFCGQGLSSLLRNHFRIRCSTFHCMHDNSIGEKSSNSNTAFPNANERNELRRKGGVAPRDVSGRKRVANQYRQKHRQRQGEYIRRFDSSLKNTRRDRDVESHKCRLPGTRFREV
jgi:hypothetical protein